MGSKIAHKVQTRYHRYMKPYRYALMVTGGALVIAGCGFNRPSAITHNSKPQVAAKEILARMSSWKSVQTTVQQTQGPKTSPGKTLNYDITSNLSNGQYVIKLKGSHPVSVYVNTHETIWYPQHGNHYSVLAQLPAADKPWAVAAELPQLIKKAQIQSMQVHGNVVRLNMIVPLSSSKNGAHATFLFNTASDIPESFSLQLSKNDTVKEVFTHFQVNPSLPSGTFTFAPPHGVTPTISLTRTGTALSLIKSQLNFPLVLPPQGAGLTLDAINTGTNSQDQRFVILTFTARDSTSVLITESLKQGSTVKLPSGVTATTQSVGSLTATVANMPNNMVEAGFLEHKTQVIVEGTASTVDSLLNDWGNLSSLNATSSSTPPPSS